MAFRNLVRLSSYLRGSRRRLVLFVSLLVVSSGATVGVPLVFRRVVDRGIQAGRPEAVLWLTAVAAGLALIAAAASAAGNSLGAAIGMELTYQLRMALYRHLVHESLPFFSRSRSGALSARVSRDTVDAQNLVQAILGTTAAQGVTFAFAVAAMVSLDPVVTLCVLASAPVFLVPVKLFARRVMTAARRQASAGTAANHHLTEWLNVSGALTRELFGSADRDTAAFGRVAREQRDAVTARNVNFYASGFFLSALGAVGYATVYLLGGLRAAHGSMSIGTLIALAALVQAVYGPLIQVTTQGIGLSTGLVALERVFEVLDHGRPAELVPTARLRRPVRSLALDNVWFRHPTAAEATIPSLAGTDPAATDPDRTAGECAERGEWALRGIDLQLVAGATTALVGASGAGKTTTALVACGLYRPDRGRVTLDGVDITTLSPPDLHRAVGMVTQDAYLLNDTLRENLLIAAPGSADDQALRAACDLAELHDLLALMPQGLDTVMGDRGYRLSGGERQRLALARVILAAPDIVILDEATAHLDSRTEAAVHRAISRHLAGRAQLVIAHRLSTISNADRIVVLDAGRVVETGTHTELLQQRGTYAGLVASGTDLRP